MATTWTRTYTTAYTIGEELAGKHPALQVAAQQMTAVQTKYAEVHDKDGNPVHEISGLGLRFENTNDPSQLPRMVFQWREIVARVLEDRAEISAIDQLRDRLEEILRLVYRQPLEMRMHGMYVKNIRWKRGDNGTGDIHYEVPQLFGCNGSLNGVQLPEDYADQVDVVRRTLENYLKGFADMALPEGMDTVEALAADMRSFMGDKGGNEEGGEGG